MKKIVFSLFLLFCFLAGCATPYQQRGFRGGYSDYRIDNNTFRVQFTGNAYTSREVVEIYAVYRCAEVTIEAGFDYFILVGEGGEVYRGAAATPGIYQSRYSHGRFSSFYIPSQFIEFTKYGSFVTIKAFRGQKPQGESSAYDAREIIQNLSAKVGKTYQGRADLSGKETWEVRTTEPVKPSTMLSAPKAQPQAVSMPVEQLKSVSEYTDRGLEHYRNARYDQAIKDFTTALSMDTNPSYSTYINRGASFFELKQYDEAMADFKQAVLLAPNNAKAYAWYGNVHYARKAYSEASEHFSKAIALEPNNAVFHLNRGHAQLKIGNRALAALDFKKACELGNRDGCNQAER